MGDRPRLPVFKGALVAVRTSRVPLAPKVAAPVYHTPEYRAWREAVIAKAGRRCEAMLGGTRCAKAEPEHRMFADHRVEIRDGGAKHDVANGECLCGGHHTAKTARERARRRAG